MKPKKQSAAPWVSKAAGLPIAFAQVREDALLDLQVLQDIPGQPSVIMVASGGCTAAALAASGKVSRLFLVDPNPAQMALTRLKLHLLQTSSPNERRRLLGHSPLPPAKRWNRLKQEFDRLDIPPDLLGPRKVLSEKGPDQSGRYEVLFASLRKALSPRSKGLLCLLKKTDPSKQAPRVAPPTPMGESLDKAFDQVMSLPNLVRLFGRAATSNQRQPFSRHFAERTRHALATLPARGNPYLSQLLLGRFFGGTVYPWLTAAPPPKMPDVTCSVSDMASALKSHPGEFDLVHLSNILDWLSQEDARRTLGLAWTALRPGGRVIIRQLNSTLDIPALGDRFQWQTGLAQELHAKDRSFFYHALFVGRKN